jgi:nucleoside-diphosphate-sugar epimerase
MKTVLLTGAGGYIGTTLVPKLLHKGYKVIAVDRYFFGTEHLGQHEHLTIVREDCRKLTAAHFQGVNAVIDLVAISNDPSGEMFKQATDQINHLSRVNTARLAKMAGVTRYLLPSSCSVYGFQETEMAVDERSPLNPLTTYAKANGRAERDILPMADGDFTAVVMRFATVYGYSPRMRFDLSINAMTYGAWENRVIPLNRSGAQWRPLVHVSDVAEAICRLLEADQELVNGQIFNIGSSGGNFQLIQLAEAIQAALPGKVAIEWYGDPDFRSYRVDFSKLEQTLGWRAQFSVIDGVMEVFEALCTNKLVKKEQTITLKWYEELVKWHKIVKECEMYGGIFDIQSVQSLVESRG